MALDFHFKNVGNHVPDTLNPRVTEFEEVVAVFADQVIVLPEAVTALVFGLFVTKLMTNNEVTVDQQLEGVVHRGARYRHILLLQAHEQLISIEVISGIVDLFKNGQALLGLPQIPLLEVVKVASADDVKLFVRERGRSHVVPRLVRLYCHSFRQFHPRPGQACVPVRPGVLAPVTHQCPGRRPVRENAPAQLVPSCRRYQ
jgi:hypothetical protein